MLDVCQPLLSMADNAYVSAAAGIAAGEHHLADHEVARGLNATTMRGSATVTVITARSFRGSCDTSVAAVVRPAPGVGRRLGEA